MIFIAMIKTSEAMYVLLNRDHSVAGFHTAEEGLLSFENIYQRAHKRSYEASMSACINWMQMQPSIIAIQDPEVIRTWVDDSENMQMQSVAGIAGHFLGLRLNTEKATPAWDMGAKPKLIGGGS